MLPLARILLAISTVVMVQACGGDPPLSVVLVTFDALRADAVSAESGPGSSTPTFATLAGDSIVFGQAISSFQGTTPSMSSLMTGRWPSFEGVPGWNPATFYGFTDLKSPEERDLPILTGNVRTLAEILVEHGWRTAGFNTNPFLSTSHNFQQGFGHYEQFLSELEELRARRRHELEPAYPPAEMVASKVSSWLREQRRQPFFAWVHLMDPHSPYLPPPPHDRRFLERPSGLDDVDLNRTLYHWLFEARGNLEMAAKHPSPESLGVSREAVIEHARGLYHGEVQYGDAALGELVAVLRDEGLLERTLLVVTADHGEEFGDHGHIFHELHQPAYDELLRVPLVIRFPDGRFSGARVGNQVRMVDLAPTILEVLGLPGQAAAMDGSSLLPVITGDDRTDRTAFVSAPGYEVVRTERWKYKRFRITASGEQLFDLVADPGETRDVLAEHPEVAADLRARYAEFAARLRGRSGTSGPTSPEAAPVDEATREQLEILGYTQ